MRALLVTAILVVPAAAHADSFLDVVGGISIPIANDDWTNYAETSPTPGAHIGATNPQGLGGQLQIDWTPTSLDNNGFSGAFANADVATHTFRFVAAFTIHKPVAPKIEVSGRAGLGIDIIHSSAHGSILGANFNSSDTDTGFAFELGGGVWYDLGSVKLGAELGIPMAFHSKNGDNTNGNYKFDYSSYNLDLLFGVRFSPETSR